MAICRYFQQGTCRFGNRCKYDHVYVKNYSHGGGYAGSRNTNYCNNYNYAANNYGPGGGGGSGERNNNERGGISILRAKGQTSSSLFQQPTSSTLSYQPGFSSSAVPGVKSVPTQYEGNEILQMLKHEVTLWQSSGQWPLSCFSLFQEQSCFPGLIDYSPEEIRWYLYRGHAMGNFEECLQLIKGIYDKAHLVKEQLLTPSPEVFEILTRLSRGEKIDMCAVSVFDKPADLATIYGNASGGNMQPALQAPSSFVLNLPNKDPPTANNQNFSALGVPQWNVFSNSFGNQIYENVPTSHSTPNIFGGASHSPLPAPINAPVDGTGYLNVTSHSQSISNSGTYTPMEEMEEDMPNAFNTCEYSNSSYSHYEI